MANTTEMLRLMRHAADLLDVCDPTTNADEVARLSSLTGVTQAALARAVAETVAMSVASTVLRMIAAAIGDEPTPPTQPPTIEAGSTLHTERADGPYVDGHTGDVHLGFARPRP
jgi:hypothetical protein